MFPVPASTLASIVARPESFLSTYQALAVGSTSARAYVQSQLGSQFSTLTDTGAIATFATVIAFNAAPLGATSVDPMNATLKELLTAQSLVCGHYCKLATLLALLGNPELIPTGAGQTSSTKPDLNFLVWQDTVPLNTGFHAQLLLTGVLDGAYLLLDPTYGYATRIPFTGSGPQAGLTTVENAATLLQTAIDQSNLAVLDPNRTSSTPQMLTTLLSGALGPQYIYHDSIYGCEGWDARIAQIFDNFG
jgi:hypothetical protein